ncbi:MAG: Zn-binding domain-containing protein, partial [Chloroflexota bacterium]
SNLWKNEPNQYGPSWKEIADFVRNRDQYLCKVCGNPQTETTHHVHHIKPFRAFDSIQDANDTENLITLCPSCHRRAERVVRIRSGLAGAAYTLGHIAPLFLMCDTRDLGVFSDPQFILGDRQPTIVIYEMIPAGIGFAQRLFERSDELIKSAFELVSKCICSDGCPSCIGPGGEQGSGSKKEVLAIFNSIQFGEK